jgi:hypothetical protein
VLLKFALNLTMPVVSVFLFPSYDRMQIGAKLRPIYSEPTLPDRNRAQSCRYSKSENIPSAFRADPTQSVSTNFGVVSVPAAVINFAMFVVDISKDSRLTEEIGVYISVRNSKSYWLPCMPALPCNA